MVNNIGTAFAVYEAVQLNKPLIERVVTVTGKAVKKPSNFMARIGTPVSHLVEMAGGVPDDTGKVVNGGPMMGKAITDLDIPVVKGTSGILFFKEEEAKRVEETNCIRCGKCMTACPMGLEPGQIATFVENKAWDEAEASHIMDCVECGSCQYTCPAASPILDHIRVGKAKVGQIIRSRSQK